MPNLFKFSFGKIFSIEDEYRHFLVNIFGIKMRFSKKGYAKHQVSNHLGGKKILNLVEADEQIFNRLSQDKPCFIARFGATELGVVEYFYKNNKNGFVEFPDFMRNDMKNMPGFFTPTNELLSRYCKEFLDTIPNIDILAVWNYCAKNLTSEEEYINNFMTKESILIPLMTLGEYTLTIDKPWTSVLEGKKVLVIHPFKDTILSQYEKRDKLFNSPYHLPNFDLKVIRAVQGLNSEDCLSKYQDWFEALESMYRQIDETDFDIAIIGAGAFGILLGNYIKNKGKKALHIGGASQILFGIKGSRWKDWGYDKYWNEYWVSPSTDESLKDLSKFASNEGGKAYW